MRLVLGSSWWRTLSRRTIVFVVVPFLVAVAAIALVTRPLAQDAPPEDAEPEDPAPLQPAVSAPSDGTTVVSVDGPVEAAVAASETFFDDAPVVLLAGEGDVAAQARASSIAVALGAPLLLVPAAGPGAGTDAAEAEGSATRLGGTVPLDRELTRLDPQAVMTFGETAAAWAQAWDRVPVVPAPAGVVELTTLIGVPLGERKPVDPDELMDAVAALEREEPAMLTIGAGSDASTGSGGQGGSARHLVTAVAAVGRGVGGAADTHAPSGTAGGAESSGVSREAGRLPSVAPAEPLDSVLVLVPRDRAGVAAAATARASGARLAVAADPDPRVDGDVIAAVADRPPERVVALGSGFGPPERLRQRLDVAETGVQLPGGGQVVFPGRRFVALYGHPGAPALGVLGEQPRDQAIARAEQRAADYQPLVDEPVVPTLEIIATVASGAPGPDGNYSNEAPVASLRPWVDAVGEAGGYVMLDLQPGRSDFLSQAKRYEELLAQPHVGLALDPEWRLRSDQRHRDQIGSVSAAEVNGVVAWLAELTRERNLPQKLLVLHQFSPAMISDRQQLDTGRDELAVLIHADGFGTPGQKFNTWNLLHTAPPPNVSWGWKNFIDEDRPTFTPRETLAVEPTPRFVSYQ